MSSDENATPLRGVRHLMLWVALVMLVLQVLGMSLVLPTGHGIDDYLGSVIADAARAMNERWRLYGFGGIRLDRLAAIYLAIDTGVFVALYGALLLAVGDKFLCATARDGRPAWPWLRVAVAGSVVALLCVDLIENLVGLWRLEGEGWNGLGLAVVLLGMLYLGVGWKGGTWLSKDWKDFVKRTKSVWLWLSVPAALGVGVALAYLLDGLHEVPAEADSVLRVGGFAHSLKFYMLLICALLLAMLGGAWFFGFCILSSTSSPQQKRESRAHFRRAVGDMLWRCRYVWFALAVFAGLAMVLNQGRDVVYSLAAMQAGSKYIASWWGGLVVAAASAVAMWSFGFAAWLWSRSVCRMHAPSVARSGEFPTSYEDRFARDLGRVAGLLPPALFVLLCGDTLHDAVMGGEREVAAWLAGFIVLAVAGGFGFVFFRIRDQGERYYNDLTVGSWYAEVRDKDKSRYRLFGYITPFWLPFYAAGALFLCRVLAAFAEGAANLPWPPMALASFLLTLTFWLSLFGWLSLCETRSSIPWVALLVIAVGALGYSPWMRNHVVGGFADQTVPPSDVSATLVALVLAVICLGVFWYFVRGLLHEKKNQDTPGFWRGAGIAVVAVLLAMGALHKGEEWIVKRSDASSTAWKRPHIDAAMKTWLSGLLEANKDLLKSNESGDLPVYFVDAEGGGIRAAYWTALVLRRLTDEVDGFRARTFSLSGVSGGSVGIAVDRACPSIVDSKNNLDCLNRLGSADLITPLLSVWLFEDVLAQIVPTAHCKWPACGVLSRGARFEQAVLRAVPKMATGLIASRTADAHQPYLFLNSTWVETGERAIASDLHFVWKEMPAARDQISYQQRDLALVTAAHNSARFPFTNAIGAFEVPYGNCRPEPFDVPDSATGATAQSGRGKDGKPEICGHLADGGYFDNSGAHTTANILDVLARCLSDDSGGDCDALNPRDKALLRQHLAPQLIAIRNGTRPQDDQQESCEKPAVLRRDAIEAEPLSRDKDRYQPGRPLCKGRNKLYAELLGPPITAFNALGLGANGRTAEAELELKLRSLVAGWRNATDEVAPVANIDLTEDGCFLYPLGWHLSPIARKGMEEQACEVGLLKNVTGPYRSSPSDLCPRPVVKRKGCTQPAVSPAAILQAAASARPD